MTGPVTDRAFEYSNLSGRPAGPVLTLAARFLSGVREVQAQVVPYAHAWEEHNRVAAAGTGPLWVTLGDSMAQGIGASRHDRGWPGQLAAALPDHRLVNLSVTGGRVIDLLERQLPAMGSLGVEPDLVTIIIGSNDLFSRQHRRDLPTALSALLDRLPAGTVMASQPGNRPGSLQFNDQLDAAAKRRGLVVAEFRDPRMRSWRGKLARDHFHPNDLGYAGMAQIMAEAVARRPP